MFETFFDCNYLRKHLEYESKLIETVLHIPRNLQNVSGEVTTANTTTTSISPNTFVNSVTSIPNTNQTSSTVSNQISNLPNNTEKSEVKMRYFTFYCIKSFK